MRTRTVLPALAAVTLLAAGCSGAAAESAPEGDGEGASPDAGAFPVSVEHTFGSTEIEERPERVVVLGWNAQDVVYALGVTPVGMPSYPYGGGDDGVLPWDDEHFDPERTTLLDTADGAPLEQIAALRPDVILAPYEGFDEGVYEDLSGIAPTVAYPGEAWTTPWRDQTRMIGQALGMADEAEELIAETEADIAAVAEEHPEFEGLTFAYTSLGAEALYLYLPSDPRVQLIEDLGFTSAPSVEELAAGTDAGTFYAQLSLEQAPEIDSDVLIGFTDGLTASEAVESDLYRSVPAIGRDAAVVLDDQEVAAASSSVSVLSIPFVLDELVDDLAAAAANAAVTATATTGTPAGTAPSGAARPGRRRARLLAGLAGLLLLLAAAAVLGIAVGARAIAPADVWTALVAPTGTDDDVVVRALRLPRTLLGVVVGLALGVAGALIQGHTRNPLADPGLLGVSAGAAFAICLAVYAFGVDSVRGSVWFGLAGALVAAVVVFVLGTLGDGGGTPVTLALAGAAVSAFLAALTSGLVLTDATTLDAYRFWVVGSLVGRGDGVLGQVLPFLLAGLLLAAVNAPALNTLQMGEDVARGLGQRIAVARACGIAAVTLLTGAAVAVSGPIAFVGLVVPHVARAITGPDHRWLLPYSGLLGAVLLLLADVVGRVLVRPAELPVGLVLAFVGAPFFIALVRRRRLVSL